MIHIEKEELTLPRTPDELCSYVKDVHERVMKDDETRHQARLKRGLYKEFLEELTPLSIYSKWKFPRNNVTCQLIIGNQGYDAIIRNLPSDPEYVEHVEITFPFDGQKHHEDAKEINEKGYCFESWNDDLSKIKEEIIRVIKQAQKKSLKDYDYKNSSLIISLGTQPYFDLKRGEHNDEIMDLVQQLRAIEYKVKSVYLVLIDERGVSPEEKVIPVIEDIE
jgi:hypothetical protein